jgi:hypothetical protein
MTQGATQYLSNTAGAISSSAGTNSKRIGKSITWSKIELYSPDYQKTIALSFTRVMDAASATVTYNHNL